ncbi:lamina-associated polypeptide 2, isoforms beta/gamma-like isoform X4 [Carassius auratus]|uniref:Lamina-associated polypeptide 2, isoforms beta/gamma-like isoform X4 n=1 Tax=Carassius auratus TaxID=7957 RepID=A0A6P6M8T9_CARAU|nr:lamina-associated polypeptide 2, isoforms beta/gamma-like isoform X4 [Carassius auratus]
MSEFLEDPSVLTKDKLKSALLAHNVALPNGEQKKDVYVQLYLKNLTAQNKKSSGSPDVFSSDEDLPPAPVLSNSSRSGRKATRKTDKVRPEDVDVIDLSNEALKDLLLKYGLNAGPIVASTRKVYEKRLQKLLDQGPPETVAPPSETSQTDGRQNGIIDSDQYSDKEEETVAPAPEFVPEPEPEVEAESIPVVERPIRSRGKVPVTSRTRSGQHHREDEDEEDVLNIKRKMKRSSRRLDQMVPASDDTENSELSSAEYGSVSQDRRRTGPVAARKEPRPLLTDRMSKLSSKTESLRRRSAPVRSFRPDLNEAPVTDKDFSKPSLAKEVSISLVRMKAQTLAEPKDPKPSKRSSTSATDWSESPKHHISPYQSTVSGLHSTTPIDKFDENAAEITSPPVRASNREPLVSLLNTACVEVEKVSAIDQTPRTVERDVLKEIFPTENLSTPTGISATCRRPIRGAAGRPLVGDTWLDESRLRLKELRETSSFSTYTETQSYTETRSVPRVAAVPLTASKPPAPPAVKSRAWRSLPVWVQLLLLSVVAGFLFFVYQAMETDEVGLFRQSGADDSTSK